MMIMVMMVVKMLVMIVMVRMRMVTRMVVAILLEETTLYLLADHFSATVQCVQS